MGKVADSITLTQLYDSNESELPVLKKITKFIDGLIEGDCLGKAYGISKVLASPGKTISDYPIPKILIDTLFRLGYVIEEIPHNTMWIIRVEELRKKEIAPFVEDEYDRVDLRPCGGQFGCATPDSCYCGYYKHKETGIIYYCNPTFHANP